MWVVVRICTLSLELLLSVVDVEVLVSSRHHFAQIAFSYRLLHIPLAAYVFNLALVRSYHITCSWLVAKCEMCIAHVSHVLRPQVFGHELAGPNNLVIGGDRLISLEAALLNR